MKHAITVLMSFLYLASPTTFAAKWVPIFKSDEPNYTLYFDEASLVKKGEIYKAWFMFDFAIPQLTADKQKKYQSVTELDYFNCAEMTKASVQQHLYPKKRGNGQPVMEFTVKDADLFYVDIIAGTPGEHKFNRICGDKPESK